jgi:hypothetical protein
MLAKLKVNSNYTFDATNCRPADQDLASRKNCFPAAMETTGKFDEAV